MPLPATLDICRDHLFSDVTEMEQKGIAPLILKRILRIRDLYNYWLAFPRKKDKEIISELTLRYNIQTSQAYDDLRIIKTLLGDLQKSSKEFHRWKFIAMIEESYEMAKRLKDPRAMVAASDKYGKYTRLDKEDEIKFDYDQIIVQPFEPTDDPSVLGFKPIPNIREKIKSKIQQYWNEDIETVDFEEVEFNEEDLFKQDGKEKV